MASEVEQNKDSGRGVARPPATVVVLLLVLSFGVPYALGQVGGTEDIRFGPRKAVDRLPCRPGDRPEPGLQGRVPAAELLRGGLTGGYACNMDVVGHFQSLAGGTLDSFEDCAYYGLLAKAGGTMVVDASDPANPRPTGLLATPAMQNPWESLRVNAKRKLLVAGNESDGVLGTTLDVYDVSDCRQPRLLSSTPMPRAKGHEGWFSPDGMTYFLSGISAPGVRTDTNVFPVDLTDPARPRQIASWPQPAGQSHGGSTTEDGARTYVCQQLPPPHDKLFIMDSSDLERPKVLETIGLQDNQWCQGAYRVTYDGRPYLVQYGERSGANDCSRAKDNWATFGYPRIYDLADERKPVLVSTALLEVHLPQHCAAVHDEGAINGLGYSVHHCSPDRLYNPTILACSWFGAGMRVLDIRDPRHPVEIGYVNPARTGIVGTASRPVVRADRGEIWFTNDLGGFYVARFRDGIWPFRDAAPCPEYDDYYFKQYNPTSGCSTASFAGLGKPAPQRSADAPAACLPAAGRLGPRGLGGRRALAPFRLGRRRGALLALAGTPSELRGSVLRWCVDGGGAVSVVIARGRVRLVATTARGHRAGDARPGATARLLRRRGFASAGEGVLRRRQVLALVAGGRVRAIATSDLSARIRADNLRLALRRLSDRTG